MAVFVDSPIWKYGRMKMCHMVADSIDELHAMAQKIGVARKHFQDKTRYPHYDICKSKRELAIENGAVSVTSREIIMVLKRFKNSEKEE